MPPPSQRRNGLRPSRRPPRPRRAHAAGPSKAKHDRPRRPSWLERQLTRTLAENLADLPTRCDVGCQRNRQGHQESWTGYKFHIDTIDGDIPISPLLTSASVHDSQVAIPLAQLSQGCIKPLSETHSSAGRSDFSGHPFFNPVSCADV